MGVLVIAGIVGLQILDDSGTSNANLGADTTTTAPVGSTASTGTTARPPNEVRVTVYNASGVDGQGQVMTDKLHSLNWNTQTPGTIKTQQTGTTVSCVAGFDAEATKLAADVGQGATVVAYPATPPADASQADCIVTLGKT